MFLDVPNIGIMGAGAFGTALAIAISQADRAVWLWARDAEQAKVMQAERRNTVRLPMADFPEGLRVTSDANDLVGTPNILLAVPTQQLRSVLTAHRKSLEGALLIACCKGVELGTGMLPSEVIADVIPFSQPGVLTGPSFAEDIALGKPTALTLAGVGDHLEVLQRDLATHNLRIYLTDDVIGAQLGGALKNVIAIAAGITIGAGLGESSRAALMTRGFAEINRLAQARGVHAETLLGLSGFGDLVLTCTSEKSRNYRYGLSIGAGQSPDSAATVEGVMTAHAVAEGADPNMLPVICMVSALLAGKVTLDEAKDLLLSRPLRHERG
jgi:glycerol-3-phosphate dehydrogenase (NAD(P)+)